MSRREILLASAAAIMRRKLTADPQALAGRAAAEVERRKP